MDLRLWTLVTPSHERLLAEWFLRTLPTARPENWSHGVALRGFLGHSGFGGQCIGRSEIRDGFRENHGS